eukprot:2333953-Prymnesium_polylepis.1
MFDYLGALGVAEQGLDQQLSASTSKAGRKVLPARRRSATGARGRRARESAPRVAACSAASGDGACATPSVGLPAIPCLERPCVTTRGAGPPRRERRCGATLARGQRRADRLGARLALPACRRRAGPELRTPDGRRTQAAELCTRRRS